jgi:hypothetical protein
LLAVAKLSEPLKKDPTNEMILRVRLDYWSKKETKCSHQVCIRL